MTEEEFKAYLEAMEALSHQPAFQEYVAMLKRQREAAVGSVVNPPVTKDGAVDASQHFVHTGMLRTYDFLLAMIEDPGSVQ